MVPSFFFVVEKLLCSKVERPSVDASSEDVLVLLLQWMLQDRLKQAILMAPD